MKKIAIALVALAVAAPAFGAVVTKPPKPTASFTKTEHRYRFTEGVECPAVGPTPCVGHTVKLPASIY